MLKNIGSVLFGTGFGFYIGCNKEYFLKKQSGFNDLSKIIPETVKSENKHAHSNVLKNADSFLTECVEKGNECSFSLAVLKNQNKNVDKKWVAFFQASDNKDAVVDMKNVTERHLKQYVTPQETTIVNYKNN